MHSQNKNQPTIFNNGGVHSDFLHCTPFEQREEISCRLYLNAKLENLAAITEQLLKKCFDKGYRVYFKFWTNNNRNDTFIVYTSYDMVERFVEVLREIRRENPKLFEGCEKINPILTNIDDFIGFGEEPKYKHSSFNEERGDAIDEFSRDVISKAVIEERKRIGNYTGLIATSRGDRLTIEEYLVYRLERSFRETILQRQRDIKNGKYPIRFVEYGDRAIRSYIEMENKIYRACSEELPPVVKSQIRESAKRYLEGLRNGRNVYISAVKFPTVDMDLFPSMSQEYKKQAIQSNGSLEYKVEIDIDMQEKLFDVFSSEEVIERVITDEALEPYFMKHHVSAIHPSLNTETEQMLSMPHSL